MPLSARRQRFVNAYLGDAAGNATQAVLAAKLTQNPNSARVIGCRLLAEASVQQALKDATASDAYTVEQAIAQLAAIAETPTEKVTSSDKIKAIELFLKARGALRDNTGESKVTVNIGFLTPSPPTDTKCHNGLTQIVTTLEHAPLLGRGVALALRESDHEVKPVD